MEEYVLPDEYTLPPVDNPQPQVKESAHRWSASSLWKDHKGKIIGGIVGGVALAAVAGGVAVSHKRARSSWGPNMYDYYNDINRETWADNAELNEDDLDERAKFRRVQLEEKAKPSYVSGDLQLMEPYRERKPARDPARNTWMPTFDNLQFSDRAFRKDDADNAATLYTFDDLPSETSFETKMRKFREIERLRAINSAKRPAVTVEPEDAFYDASDDHFFDAPEPMPTYKDRQRERDLAWRKDAREVNKRLGVGDYLANLANQKWEMPPGIDYEEFWDRDRDCQWG